MDRNPKDTSAEVMTSSVSLKDTARPLLSLSRPSSSTCARATGGHPKGTDAQVAREASY